MTQTPGDRSAHRSKSTFRSNHSGTPATLVSAPPCLSRTLSVLREGSVPKPRPRVSRLPQSPPSQGEGFGVRDRHPQRPEGLNIVSGVGFSVSVSFTSHICTLTLPPGRDTGPDGTGRWYVSSVHGASRVTDVNPVSEDARVSSVRLGQCAQNRITNDLVREENLRHKCEQYERIKDPKSEEGF